MNQLPRLVASSHCVPASRNEYQIQMAGVIGTTTPKVNEQATLAPFNFGSNGSSTVTPINIFALDSSLSTRPTLSNLKICNSVILTQMANGGGTTGNLPEGGTVGHQTVGDQENSYYIIDLSSFLIKLFEKM
jgi:two-component response regulator (ARR-B family)